MQPDALGNNHFLQLSMAGTKLNLSFSGYEVLNTLIMALDGVNRKVLLLPLDANVEPIIIHLGEVVNISVKKVYAGIPAGGLKLKALEAFLEKIQLEFEITGKEAVIVVPVYDCNINQLEQRAKLEKKARNWQQLLMKLTGSSRTKPMNKVLLLSKSNMNNIQSSTN